MTGIGYGLKLTIHPVWLIALHHDDREESHNITIVTALNRPDGKGILVANCLQKTTTTYA